MVLAAKAKHGDPDLAPWHRRIQRSLLTFSSFTASRLEQDNCPPMSEKGPKRTNHRGPKSTVVRFGPKADKLLQCRDCPLCAMCGRLRVGKGFLHFCSIGRCSHVFGLLVRHTWPLAIMPSADQVPVISTHSTMRWHKWVVLIAGSTGSALRAVRPFQPSHHAGCPARSRLCRKRDGFLVSLAPGHHGPGHAGNLVGKRDGGDLGGPPRQQCREPGPMPGAIYLGIANDGERPGHEQAAQIAIALLTDTAEPVLAPARMLLWHPPDPGREVAP